jgi:ABC-type nitrate/sulfonate/bicarbonate transport system substrate-binding protein
MHASTDLSSRAAELLRLVAIATNHHLPIFLIQREAYLKKIKINLNIVILVSGSATTWLLRQN